MHLNNKESLNCNHQCIIFLPGQMSFNFLSSANLQSTSLEAVYDSGLTSLTQVLIRYIVTVYFHTVHMLPNAEEEVMFFINI